MKYLKRLFFLIIAVSCIYKGKGEICNPQTGPNGARDCIKVPWYKGYQWATCRTDEYIRSKSNGKHFCIYSAHKYCYYQCMVEEYRWNSGVVFGKCRCSPSGNGASKRAASTYNVVFLALLTICLMFTAL